MNVKRFIFYNQPKSIWRFGIYLWITIFIVARFIADIYHENFL